MEVNSLIEILAISVSSLSAALLGYLTWRVRTEANKPKVEAEAAQNMALAFKQMSETLVSVMTQSATLQSDALKELSTRGQKIDQLEETIRDLRDHFENQNKLQRTAFDEAMKLQRDQADDQRRLDKEDNNVLRDQVRDLAVNNGQYEADIKNLKESRNTLREEVAELKRGRALDAEEITELKAEVLTLQRSGNMKDAQHAEAERVKDVQLAQAYGEIDKLKADVIRLQNEIDTLRQQTTPNPDIAPGDKPTTATLKTPAGGKEAK